MGMCCTVSISCMFGFTLTTGPGVRGVRGAGLRELSDDVEVLTVISSWMISISASVSGMGSGDSKL